MPSSDIMIWRTDFLDSDSECTYACRSFRIFQNQEDDLQIQKKYIRTCCAIALICFPALTGLCVLAGPFVRVVLGEQWIEAVPLIILMAPIGIIQSLATTVGVLYMIKGKTDWLLLWELFAGTSLTISYFAVLLGINGVAAVTLIFMIFLTYQHFPYLVFNPTSSDNW